MTIENNPSTASPKLTSMTFPRKIHFSLLVFYTLSRGKKIQTVSTPPLQLGFFSFGPVVGKKGTRFQRQARALNAQNRPDLQNSSKNDSTDPIDRPNKTRPFSNSTRTFFFLTNQSTQRLGPVKKPDMNYNAQRLQKS